MIIDHITMIIVMFPIAILVFFLLIFLVKDTIEIIFLDIHGYALLFSIYVIYFLKDNWKGKSLGKRIIGLQVVDRKTDETASSFQCFFRNLFIVLWPLEVIVTLFSPKRRIGDLFANTKIVEAEKESPKSLLGDIKNTKVNVMQVFLITLVTVPFCYLLAYIMVSINS
ncbi:RDD family protein [Muricauda sp. SCSIO 65647]|nr:RDD family protein [Muricauda sp. SCSIO 65647]